MNVNISTNPATSGKRWKRPSQFGTGWLGGGPYHMRFRTMYGVRVATIRIDCYADYLATLDDADVIDLTYAGQ